MYIKEADRNNTKTNFKKEDYIYVTECIVCVQVHDPLSFSFLSSFLFSDCVGFMAPILESVTICALGQQRPFFPQCPYRGRLFVCCCDLCSRVHLRGEPTLFPGWCK